MAVSGGITEKYGPSGPIVTFSVATAVVAGNVVAFTATKTVDPATADSVKVAGVALRTASANTDVVDVANQGYFNLVANGAISAGDRLKVGAVAGTVKKWTNADDADMCIGYAVADILDTATGLCYLRV